MMASLSAHPGTERLRHQPVPAANIQDLGLLVTGNILVNFVGNKLGNKKVCNIEPLTENGAKKL